MKLLAFILLGCLSSAFASFGVTTSGTKMLVDSGGGLVTTSERSSLFLQNGIHLLTVNTSNGDIISLDYNGKELQDSTKFTQLSSGLGSATVTSTVDNDIAVVTIETDTIVGRLNSVLNFYTKVSHRNIIILSGRVKIPCILEPTPQRSLPLVSCGSLLVWRRMSSRMEPPNLR